MNEHVFLLTGKPRIGKSTMIKKLIHDIGPDSCGGFYTEEIKNSSDRIGFRCVSINGESVEIANVDSPSQIRVGRYGVNIEAFEKFAITLLEDAMHTKKIIIIDEIGFMQILSATFQKTVQQIVADNRMVVGTIPVDGHPEIDKIKSVKQVKLIEINEFNRNEISESILKDIKKGLL
ncbi:nucleoside-triphosphatase [Paenibacillus sp. YIM B09110]|uniref:nucleoside-triphosphatase n=1 Tax=Paenibacillus sp. YIM B09110 TaxID=3126102 RepID=UPI00301D139A